MSCDRPRCPRCQRFVEKDPDGYFDTAEKNGEPEFAPVAAFCDERCACLFHDRPVPADYWRPLTNKARQMRLPNLKPEDARKPCATP